jgi:hypothetical protein
MLTTSWHQLAFKLLFLYCAKAIDKKLLWPQELLKFDMFWPLAERNLCWKEVL